MRAAISVLGRFQAFQLAEQLQKRDALAQLITSYPKFKVVEYGVRPELVSSLVWLEAIKRAWAKVPLSGKWNSQYFFASLYDRFASKALRPGADLFVGWSGCSLKTLRRAKSLGMIGLIVRCSSHMRYQQKVMEEEYALLGLPANSGTHPKIIEQELAEYEEADYIETLSPFARRTFLSEGVPEKKILMVPLGSDISFYKPVPKEDSIFRVVFLGPVCIRKGVHHLLQAFSELRLPNAELSLVGFVTDEIKPFLAKYESPQIRVHGFAPEEKLPWYLSQGSVFCLPSIEDGFGIVLLYAMACGLPIICSNNTGGEGVVREGVDGFIVPFRDVGALKEKIRWCYEHQEECRAMGQSACERSAQGFSWDAYGERISAAYMAAVAASRQPSAKDG